MGHTLNSQLPQHLKHDLPTLSLVQSSGERVAPHCKGLCSFEVKTGLGFKVARTLGALERIFGPGVNLASDQRGWK